MSTDQTTDNYGFFDISTATIYIHGRARWWTGLGQKAFKPRPVASLNWRDYVYSMVSTEKLFELRLRVRIIELQFGSPTNASPLPISISNALSCFCPVGCVHRTAQRHMQSVQAVLRVAQHQSQNTSWHNTEVR